MTDLSLNGLSPAVGSKHSSKRVGRGIGSGLGKTCGRGHKGQKSRSGGSVKPGFEGGQMPIQRRVPKFGFTSQSSLLKQKVRTSDLNSLEGEVSIESLKEAGVIKKSTKQVKIFLSGDVAKALTVKSITVSKGAQAAIEAAGGKVEG